MKNFKINQFRFLKPDDTVDMQYDNWSRCYEWKWVTDLLAGYEGSIHNTCCGTKAIHGQFCNNLNKVCKNVTHSDFIPTEFHLERFELVDMTADTDEDIFDCVVCVSTLEEIPNTEIALKNVIKSAKHKVVLTFDYPDVDLEMVERIVGQKCLDVGERLSGLNSVRPAPHYSHLNVVILELESI